MHEIEKKYRLSARSLRTAESAEKKAIEIEAAAQEAEDELDDELAEALKKLAVEIRAKDYGKKDKPKESDDELAEVEEKEEESDGNIEDAGVDDSEVAKSQEIKDKDEKKKAKEEKPKGITGIKAVRYAATFITDQLPPFDEAKSYIDDEITKILIAAGYFEFEKNAAYTLAKDGTLLITIKGSTKGGS